MADLGLNGDSLERVIERQRREIAQLNEVLHRKNVELDALHMVWCDGACPNGSGRFTDAQLTEEVVVAAERNTARMRRRFEARKFVAARTERAQRGLSGDSKSKES